MTPCAQRNVPGLKPMIRLIDVGWVSAIPVEQVCVGQTLIVDYGERHQIIEVRRNPRHIRLTLKDKNGATWKLNQRKETLVAAFHKDD